LGRSRGGFSTNIQLRAEGGGKPLTFCVTAGQRHEAVEFERLMEHGAVRRATGGRPKLRPQRSVGDKGYRSKRIRHYLQRRGIRMTIPRTTNERRTGPFDRAIYRERNQIERLINRLKQYRRIATRYEKRAANYVAMLTLVAIRLWL
jgi:transposase